MSRADFLYPEGSFPHKFLESLPTAELVKISLNVATILTERCKRFVEVISCEDKLTDEVNVRLPKITALGSGVVPPGITALVKTIRIVTGWKPLEAKRALQEGQTLHLSKNEGKLLRDAIKKYKSRQVEYPDFD